MGNRIAKRLAEIENKGISLQSNAGKIAFKAAKGSLSEEDKAFLKDNKSEVLKYLDRAKLTMQDILKDTEVSVYEKFPLTDIQAAYAWICEQGYKVLSNGIEELPFWEKGVAFFIIEGPNKERIEFCERKQ